MKRIFTKALHVLLAMSLITLTMSCEPETNNEMGKEHEEVTKDEPNDKPNDKPNDEPNDEPSSGNSDIAGSEMVKYSGKKMVKWNNIILHYDNKDRLIKYDYQDGDYIAFEYGDGYVFWFNNWNHSAVKAILNPYGLVVTTESWCMGGDCGHSTHPSYEYDDEWYFEYDLKGHLTKWGDNTYFYNLEWDSNGNVTKITNNFDEEVLAFEYGSKPIENKMGFMLSYDMIWGVDMDSYDDFTLARTMGAGTKHLPISRSDGTTFNWELDKDGYPISVTIKRDGESEKESFVWE